MGYTTGEGRKIIVQEEKIHTWTFWDYDVNDGKYKQNKQGSIILEEGSDDYNDVVMMRVVTEDGDCVGAKTGTDAVLYLKDIEHLIDGLEKLRRRMILTKADQDRDYRLNNEGENE